MTSNDKDQLLPEEEKDMPEKKRKLSPSQALGAAIGLSVAVHGAALGVAAYEHEKKANDEHTLAIAKDNFSDTTSSPYSEKTNDVIPVETLSEEEFEATIGGKILKSKDLDVTLRDLTELYERRRDAFHEATFKDLKDNGVLDSSYADFLIKQAAYKRTLDSLGTRQLKIQKVTAMQKRFAEIVEIVKNAIGEIPVSSEPDIDTINAMNGTLVQSGILKDYDGGSALFDNLILRGQGNCSGISFLSMAVYREIFGRQGYRYLSYGNHTRTIYTDPKGTKYRYENVHYPNNGQQLNGDDPNAVELPAESMVMAYLETFGYSRSKFPAGLQAHWQKNVETNVTDIGTGDSPWGDIPSGKCTDGSTTCDADYTQHYSIRDEFKAEVEKKLERIEDMSLAELLDADFFQSNAFASKWQFDEGEGKKPLTVVYNRIEWNADEQRIKKAIEARLEARHWAHPPPVERVYELTKAQLNKLQLFLDYGYALLPPELQKFRDEELPGLLDRPAEKNEIAKIQQIKDDKKKSKAIYAYVQQYRRLPLELALAIPQESNSYPTRFYQIGEFIDEISSIELMHYIDKQYIPLLKLNIAELTPGMIDQIGNAEQIIEIDLPNFTLRNVAIAHRIGQKWANKSINIGGIETPEAAAALASYPLASLTISTNNDLTPEKARALCSGKIRDLQLPFYDNPEPVLLALDNFKGESFSIDLANQLDARTTEGESPRRTEQFRLANALGKIPVSNLFVRADKIYNPLAVDVLRHAAADKVTLLNVEDISDDVAWIIAKSDGKILMTDGNNLRERTLGVTAPEQHDINIRNLRIAEYLTPSPERIKFAEESPAINDIQDFMKRYGQPTPAMIDKLIPTNGLVPFIDLFLTQIDMELAHHIHERLDQQNITNGLPIFHITILKIDPEAARTLFSVINSNTLYIIFGDTPSDETLKAIIDTNANHPPRTLGIRISSPLTENQAKILANYTGNSLNIDCRRISSKAASALQNQKNLELTIREPIDEETAREFVKMQGSLIINQMTRPEGQEWVTPKAAQIFARDFKGSLLQSNPATLKSIDRYR